MAMLAATNAMRTCLLNLTPRPSSTLVELLAAVAVVARDLAVVVVDRVVADDVLPSQARERAGEVDSNAPAQGSAANVPNDPAVLVEQDVPHLPLRLELRHERGAAVSGRRARGDER